MAIWPHWWESPVPPPDRASIAVLLAKKQDKLFAILRDLEQVLVAYSGGTDSAYLAWAAARVLGDKAVAITADSASIPESHKRDAEEFAREANIRHEYIQTFEFDNPKYVANNPDRCFHCKDELFTRLDEVGAARGIRHIIYGVNKDDLGDYRPGQNAARLHEVKAPLVEAELTKAEIRELSRISGLKNMGPAGIGLPEFSYSLRNPCDARDDQDCRVRRGSHQGARIPAVSGSFSRRTCPNRNLP